MASSDEPAPGGTLGMTRKLAAILSADVAEYSRLMGEDEEATIRTVTAYRDVMAASWTPQGITCWRSLPVSWMPCSVQSPSSGNSMRETRPCRRRGGCSFAWASTWEM